MRQALIALFLALAGSGSILAAETEEYMPVHPSEFGQEWNVQALVIPKLFKGTVF